MARGQKGPIFFLVNTGQFPNEKTCPLYLYLKFLKRNLLIWRHFEMSSSLLLRIEDSVFRIMSFSDKHKSHFLDPMRKGKLLCKIEKLTWHSAPCDFYSQTYLDSSVLSLYAGYLKDDLWSLYLCLKFSLKPMYRPSPPTFVDTTPSYTIAGVRHSPFNGQGCEMQLQVFCSGFVESYDF